MSDDAFQRLIDEVDRPESEGRLFDEIKSLRSSIRLVSHANRNINTESRGEAIERAIGVVSVILPLILKNRDPKKGEAGHGPGHWCRDFIHALYLAHDPEIPVSDVLPGIIGGMLHDIGTLFVDRYADRPRALRHAEVGALLVRSAALQTKALNEEEADLVAYSIAAHTHVQRATEVVCRDGVMRIVSPYGDMYDNHPLLPIWLTRWADRLDCSGPLFPARHYLTLHRDHEDWGKDGFYRITFAEHLRTALRTPKEIEEGSPQTMLEHLIMFANSQHDSSVYGRHDRGLMKLKRDEYRLSLEYIIKRIRQPKAIDVDRIVSAWTLFLQTNVEPTELGALSARELEAAFTKLEPDLKCAWANGFRSIMAEYHSWSDRLLCFLDGLPQSHLSIPGLFTDVRDVIRPHHWWNTVLWNK